MLCFSTHTKTHTRFFFLSSLLVSKKWVLSWYLDFNENSVHKRNKHKRPHFCTSAGQKHFLQPHARTQGGMVRLPTYSHLEPFEVKQFTKVGLPPAMEALVGMTQDTSKSFTSLERQLEVQKDILQHLKWHWTPVVR